ncbi:thiamine diphosphokinase [Oceanobacillus sp. FSL H7-0719]|uniref:thiamine diphosphokinase n=1 Tax=Oceanobacillus sp. FSL H7-0719 TaxID=2954507 RepID=UPI00324E7A9D
MKYTTIGIVGNGPEHLIPDLSLYKDKVDFWIGADRGALLLVKNELPVHVAIGDFDSTDAEELEMIKSNAFHFERFPKEKDETDFELAINKAISLGTDEILLFGATGARIDHELINIQLLHTIANQGIKGIIIDSSNHIEWTEPGVHTIEKDAAYPVVSFIPFTEYVSGITLEGFYYPLNKANIRMGSTITISNKLIKESGTFSYERGILLVIKSRD